MKTILKVFGCLTTLSISGTAIAEDKSLPRVLLIGDSFCGGYQKGVKKQLEGKAEVVKKPIYKKA